MTRSLSCAIDDWDISDQVIKVKYYKLDFSYENVRLM